VHAGGKWQEAPAGVSCGRPRHHRSPVASYFDGRGHARVGYCEARPLSAKAQYENRPIAERAFDDEPFRVDVAKLVSRHRPLPQSLRWIDVPRRRAEQS
jgi:hypothetical protein